LRQHIFHPHLLKFHFLAACILKKAIYGLVELHLRVVREGLRPHEFLEHWLREVVNGNLAAIHHLLVETTEVVVGADITIMVDGVLEEVALTGRSVLISVEGPHQLLIRSEFLPMANDSFFVDALLAFLGR